MANEASTRSKRIGLLKEIGAWIQGWDEDT